MNRYNLPPSEWFCLSNLYYYPYDKWIYFKDLKEDIFEEIWRVIEQHPNLILNDDFTAFKKVKYVNFNRLNQEVFGSSKRDK